MKVLFVSALLPYPLFSGGQIRIYNLLRSLSSKHDITLYSFIRNKDEKKYLDKLNFCKKVVVYERGRAWQAKYILKTSVSSYPFLLTTYDHPRLKEALRSELAQGDYDLVHIEPWYVYPIVPNTDPLVVSEHNVEYSIYEVYAKRFSFPPFRPVLKYDVAKMRSWEEEVWKRAKKVIVVSEDDARIVSQATSNPPTVVPNGVDLKLFNFKPKKIKSILPVFLFVGSFSWMQNRDAVTYLIENIWPKLKMSYPRSSFRVVGRGCPVKLKDSIRKSNALLLESVESIQPEYYNADILLSPIRIGGGTKFKILEAMACGLPVITTTLGAAGLNIKHRKECLIADTADEILFAVRSILADKYLRFTLQKNARKIIEAEYSWESIAQKLDAVWRSV